MPTLARRRETIYTDLRGDLEPHPVSGDLLVYKNEEAVIQSIKNLLLTDRYERIYQPRVGSQIRALLFENITIHTQNNLRKLIIECIDNFEPRAILHEVEIVAIPDQNALGVIITFSLQNSTTAPVQFELLIDRVR